MVELSLPENGPLTGPSVVSELMPDAHSVSVGVWVAVGGRDEDPSMSGASHFLEHLLFKGTERRTARASVWRSMGSSSTLAWRHRRSCSPG